MRKNKSECDYDKRLPQMMKQLILQFMDFRDSK